MGAGGLRAQLERQVAVATWVILPKENIRVRSPLQKKLNIFDERFNLRRRAHLQQLNLDVLGPGDRVTQGQASVGH